jgi:cell division protease FtsH
MIEEQYNRAKKILSEHREEHNQLAQLLIEMEVIFAEDVECIFGKRPWTSRSEEIIASKQNTVELDKKSKLEKKNDHVFEEK